MQCEISVTPRYRCRLGAGKDHCAFSLGSWPAGPWCLSHLWWEAGQAGGWQRSLVPFPWGPGPGDHGVLAFCGRKRGMFIDS